MVKWMQMKINIHICPTAAGNDRTAAVAMEGGGFTKAPETQTKARIYLLVHEIRS